MDNCPDARPSIVRHGVQVARRTSSTSRMLGRSVYNNNHRMLNLQLDTQHTQHAYTFRRSAGAIGEEVAPGSLRRLFYFKAFFDGDLLVPLILGS